MKKFKIVLLVLFSICVGILIGGYLFSQSQPRSFLALNRCQNCLTHEDLLGLVASVGIQKFPGLMPFVVFETDKTIAVIERRISNAIIRVKKGAVQTVGCIRAREAEKQPSSRSHLIIHPSVRPEYLDGRWPRCS